MAIWMGKLIFYSQWQQRKMEKVKKTSELNAPYEWNYFMSFLKAWNNHSIENRSFKACEWILNKTSKAHVPQSSTHSFGSFSFIKTNQKHTHLNVKEALWLCVCVCCIIIHHLLQKNMVKEFIVMYNRQQTA